MSNVCQLARQISRTSDHLSELAIAVDTIKNQMPEAVDVYHGMILDEVEHVQLLVLEITRLITEQEEKEDESEGSVFAGGELESKLGEKTGETPEAT